MGMKFHWGSIPGFVPALLKGAELTLLITAAAIGIGIVIGIVVAAGRVSRIGPARFLASIYVEFIRNTPALLQIFIIYFGLPSMGLRMSAVMAGIIGLGINAGAYLAEIFRAGLNGVPKGSREAATALAFSRRHTFLYVTVPLAMRASYPAFCNLVISILLASSLLSAISVFELTGVTNDISTKTFLTFEVYSVAALLYIALNLFIAGSLALLGKYLFPTRAR
jgi:polar amino acid transport system permease protein